RAPDPRGCSSLRAADAALVHGRGVRGAAALPVLHRPHRSGDRGSDTGRQEARVRELCRLLRSRRSRPAGPADVRALEAPARAGGRGALRVLPRAARVAPPATAGSLGRGRRRSSHAPRSSRRCRAETRFLGPERDLLGALAVVVAKGGIGPMLLLVLLALLAIIAFGVGFT